MNEEQTKPTDTELLDWMQKMMTPDNNYCELYFAGLRNWTGKASAYQVEANEEKFKTVNAPTLREAIALAMKQVEKYDHH